MLIEAAPLEQRNGQRVAHGHRHCRARCRGEVQRTGLFTHAAIQRDVARLRQRRADISRQRDELHLQPFQRLQQTDEFFRLAAIGHGQHRVAPLQHAQIAVMRFGGVKKKRWRARARKRRGNFPPDQPRLAHPAYDNAALAANEKLDGPFKACVEALQDFLNRLRLDFQHAARGVQTHERPRTKSGDSKALRLGSRGAACRRPRMFLRGCAPTGRI